MQCEVNIHKLRPGIRYTFTDNNARVFRATLETYQSHNGTCKEAVRLRNVEGLQGALCTPISCIRKVQAYALPNSIPYFPYLIPEVNMLINQHV